MFQLSIVSSSAGVAWARLRLLVHAVDAQRDAKSQDLVPFGTEVGLECVVNICLCFIYVAHERVRCGVGSKDCCCATCRELVQLFVQVVRLVQSLAALRPSATATAREGTSYGFQANPRFHSLHEQRIVPPRLGGRVRRLGEVFAVEREQELNEDSGTEGA